jgi:hypothetical protein
MPAPHRLALAALLPLFALACGSNEPSGTTPEGPPGPLTWSALPTDGAPSPRYLHSAVWTGNEMIVWGGDIGGMAPATDTGARYDPEKKTWTPTSSQGAPSPRHSHTAVWTGDRMIVWGGYGASALATDGGVYYPATDTWKPISTTNQPAPRFAHTAVWAGNRMIVWGGTTGAKAFADGGIYDPITDTWTTINAAGAPKGRAYHAAVSTGDRMIVWGGNDFMDWRNDGGLFDPQAGPSGVWLTATSILGVPERRERPAAAWTGSALVIWGGWHGGLYPEDGGILDVAKEQWTATSAKDAPTPRVDHVTVWAGNRMVVWGGCSDDMCTTVHDDGGQFVPSASGGVWYPIAAQPDALPGRREARGVLADKRIIIWGGRTDKATRTNTGAEATL